MKKSDKSISIEDAIAFFKNENPDVMSISEDAEGEFISTGLLALDYALSGRWIDGGIPRGKIIEIYGKSQGAKSAMLYSILAGTQRQDGFSNVIDVEGGRSQQFMRLLAVDTERCQLIKLDHYTVETVFGRINTVVKSVKKLRENGFTGPVTIGLDSIAALSTDQDIKIHTGKKEENLKEDQGRRAKLIGHWERTISPLLHRNDVTLVLINQLRERVGVMYGPKETTTSGRATEYFSDCRIDMRPRATITKDSFASRSEDDEKPKGTKIGRYFDFSCEKSRQTAPFRSVADVELYFNQGLVPLSGVFGMLLADEIIIHTGAGRYIVSEPETRLTHRLAPLANAKKFTRADVEEGDWIFENADVFGATEEQLRAYIEPNRRAHEYARALRADSQEAKKKSVMLEGNAPVISDDIIEAPLAVKRAKKKADSIPLGETE